MSFCLRPNVCKKCGKPLTLFEGWTCLECEKAEQELQCTEHPCLGILCRYYKEPCRVKNELNIELNELKPYDDVISREMALKECHDIVVDGERYRVIQEETLLGLPPVTPSCDKCAMNGSGSKYCDNCGPKSGKWIDYSDEGYVECPFCGHATNCEDDIDELHYCFFCGARMESNNNE